MRQPFPLDSLNAASVIWGGKEAANAARKDSRAVTFDTLSPVAKPQNRYVIKNVGWNYEIAPDASVSFGYTLSDYSSTNPDKFELCAKRVDKTDGYDVQYNITNEWDTGLQGEIVITNTSEEPLEAWELSFDSTFAINNLWNGRIISSEDMSSTSKFMSYNRSEFKSFCPWNANHYVRRVNSRHIYG